MVLINKNLLSFFFITHTIMQLRTYTFADERILIQIGVYMWSKENKLFSEAIWIDGISEKHQYMSIRKKLILCLKGQTLNSLKKLGLSPYSSKTLLAKVKDLRVCKYWKKISIMQIQANSSECANSFFSESTMTLLYLFIAP